ncbi:MAG: hypothetical protein JWR38_879 [Mucilaginibacter sp.]|nr:hypothetical protein [Mucilaginibacter sp.]
MASNKKQRKTKKSIDQKTGSVAAPPVNTGSIAGRMQLLTN